VADALGSALINAGAAAVAVQRLAFSMSPSDADAAAAGGGAVGAAIYALAGGLPGALLAAVAGVPLASLTRGAGAVPCAAAPCAAVAWLSLEAAALGGLAGVALQPYDAGAGGPLYFVALTGLAGLAGGGAAVCTYSSPPADARAPVWANAVEPTAAFFDGFYRAADGTWARTDFGAKSVLALRLYGG